MTKREKKTVSAVLDSVDFLDTCVAKEITQDVKEDTEEFALAEQGYKIYRKEVGYDSQDIISNLCEALEDEDFVVLKGLER